MTLQRRSHKLVKRQVLGGPTPSDTPADPPVNDPPAGGGQNGGNGGTKPPPGGDGGNGGPPRGGGNGGGNGGNGSSQSVVQSTSAPAPRPTPSSEKPSTSKTPDTSTSATPTTTSTSSSSATASTPTTTSTTQSTSSTSPSSTSTQTFVLTAPARTNTLAPSSLAPIISSSSHSPSATASPSTSSGVKVGSIVGGIAGGLVGIAILGFLISFVLRRLRKRNRRDTIIGDDFRRSEFLGSNTPINDPPLQPPSMTQVHRDSTASGPGMAGQGAYRTGNPMYNEGASAGYGARHGVPDWGTNTGTAASRHDYAQRSTDEMDDMSHGIYSSQPQQQMAYNPEAYGSYATYGQDPHAVTGGYQEATREYQGQKAYNAGGYHGQEFGVAVADPGRTSPTSSAAHPSALTPALRDQSAAAPNRQQNARSVVDDDDVYGGI